MSQNESNTFVSKRYVPIKKIGEGAMGTVYRCTDITVNRTVAIKILNENLDSSFIRRFHKEAKATAKLDHPNIIRVLDFGQTDDGKLFLAMDNIEGVGLDSIIKDKGFLGLEEALSILVQIADGLKHSHSHNIIHRDIKPSNIIIAKDSKGNPLVKILDFGIAKFDDESDQELTKTGAALGSAAYMSPEAASGNKPTKASDIYSFGCLMFELLTGEKPFIGDSYMETLIMQKEQKPPSLSKTSIEDFPESVENIVSKCLEKIPEKRYETVSELIADLNNYNKGVSIGNLSELINDFEASTAGDNRRMVYIVSGIALFFLIGVSVLLYAEQLISITSVFTVKNKKEKKEVPLQTFVFNQFEEIKPKLINHARKNTYDVVGNVRGEKEQLDFLKNKDDIVGINFTADDLKGDTLEYLSTKSLSHFDAQGCEFDDRTFAYLSKAKNLTSIKLESAHGLTRKAMTVLSNLPKLTRVNITKTAVTDEQFAPLCNSPVLSSLDISLCPLLTKESFSKIAKIQSLKLFVVKYNNLENEEFKMLSASKSITNLELTALPSNHLKYLKKMNVGTLIVYKNESLTDKEALKLGALPNLDRLELVECPNLSASLKIKLKAAEPNLRVLYKAEKKKENFPLLEMKPEDKFSH